MKLTAESFLTVVRKSGLIEPELLQKLLAEWRKSGIKVDDSHALAAVMVKQELVTEWQVDKLLQGKARGFFLSKYRLLSLLGKGGMSSVYLAEHVLMRRHCAIKVLPQKRVNDSSYLGRFHREAQAVASLDHPNIVRAYDVDVDRNIEKDREIHFLVMEYVNGRSLQELVTSDGAVGCVRAADFIRQAADGLTHAHTAGMVHRDIKPGNLLVDANGTVKILDLGLARFFNDSDKESLTVAHDEKVLGTADYLAPEQALDSHTVDARADLYSLGCTIYFLLTGHPPFTSGTLAQRLMAHQTKEPPGIETERDDVPDDLLVLVRKLMAKDVDERFQSAQDVSDAMTAWLQQHGGDEWNPVPNSTTGSGTKIAPVASAPETAVGNGLPASNADDNLAAFLTNLNVDGNVGENGTPPDSGVPAQPVREEAAERPQQSGVDDNATPDELRSEGGTTVTAAIAKPITEAGSTQTVRVAMPVSPKPAIADTPKANTAAVKEPASPDAGSKAGTNRTLMIAGIAVAALSLLGGIGWGIAAYLGDGSQDPDEANPTNGGNSTKSVVRNGSSKNNSAEIAVGPKAKYKSLKEALAEVRKRCSDADGGEMTQVIRLTGGATYKDRILFDNSQFTFENLTLKIVCDSAKPAILAPPGSEPVLKLLAMKQFSLEGVEIRSDNGRNAIRIFGNCHGLRLKNLVVSGYTTNGILGEGLQGFIGADEEMRFQNIHFRGKGRSVGLRLTGDTSWVQITGCRFFGPMSAGIVYGGDPTDCSVTQSVFHNVGDGIRLQGVRKLLRFKLRNNTFHQSQNGIVFTNMPAEGTGELVMSRNLFAKLRGNDIAIRANFKAAPFRKFLPSDGSGLRKNMTDRAAEPAKNLPYVFRGGSKGVKLDFRSIKTDDPQFLLPNAKAKHKDVGATQK